MDELDNSVLIAKGREMYGLKIRCTHNETTLVQHDDPEFGWFACYQCERCGAITRREVTADDLDVANNAPWLDVAMYEQATTERGQGETLAKALVFFGKATR
jgi:hypothetical protein